MTEPIKTLGGLSYNPNQVETAKKISNGQYQIVFKTGDVLTYPEQHDFVILGLSSKYIPKGDDAEFNCSRYDFSTTTGSIYSVHVTPAVGNPKSVEQSCREQSYVENLKKGDVVPRKASVNQARENWGIIYDDNMFNIHNVNGATFTSTKKNVSNVLVDNCTNCTIDLKANDSKWYGDNVYIDGGKNNKAILDDNDTQNYREGSLRPLL